VALTLLGNAHKAGARLLRSSDDGADRDEALHDFRVGVRRLRSWIRAFKPWLKDGVSRKHRKRIADIADATGVARDAAVHLEWLHGERRGMGKRQRIGEAWLRDRLEKRRQDGMEAALAAAGDLDALHPKLKRRLNVYRAEVIEDARPPRFGVIVAKRLVEEADALREHLAVIEDDSNVEEAHRARIAAKRLRYVMEPVSELVPGADAIIETLKALQDSLGDLHDVHVFSQEVTEANADVNAPEVSPGLLRVARRLHERGTRAYAGVERAWLHGANAKFLDEVRAVAAEIERRASIGSEIEHKYLLKRLPSKTHAAPSVEIAQGYLAGETLVERIRRVRAPDGSEQWFRTVKVGSGVERMELEEEASADVGRAMWRLTKGHRVRKRRYSIRESEDVLWEIDELLDRKLVLAEIEVASPDEQVELPAWLRDVVDREVTDEPEFSNARLAR
jgi:CHAD domain-containing protein/CYTH domain-containing protein